MSIKRHTAYNFLGGLLPLAVSLIAVPIYLKLIGIERYGILTLAWVLLGYFGLFDLGLTKATAQRISARGASVDARSRTFWSALVANCFTGVIGGIGFYFVGTYLVLHTVKIDPSLRAEALAAMPILAAAVPLATISGVVSGALIGRERFLETNVIGVLSSVLTQLVPIAVAWFFGVNLSGLILSVVAARIFTLILTWIVCRRHVIEGAPFAISRAEILVLLSFGGWVTISSFVGPIMIVFDRFVIGAVLGAAAVTVYTVPWQLAQRLLQLPSALQTAIFPRQAAAGVEEQHRLTNEGVRAVIAVTTPIVVAAIFLIEPFLKLWLGRIYDPACAEVGRIALVGFWAMGVAYVPFAQVEARGHARIAAIVHLIEVPVYLGLLFLLMKWFGLAGAAAAFALRCLVDAVVFNQIALRDRAMWKGPVALGALVLVTAALADLALPLSITWLSAFALTFGLATFLSYREAPQALREMIKSIGLKWPVQPIS
jgi:O-antigen/teichoic acid export membrane protein